MRKAEELIGRKVRLIENERMTDTPFTVIAVKGYDEAEDWCRHYVLRHESGKEIEVPEHRTVIQPVTERDGGINIYKFLSDNECWAEEVNERTDGTVEITITRGDWKHGHRLCDVLMGYLGYVLDNEEETETDGSDTYSAIHYYSKKQ